MVKQAVAVGPTYHLRLFLTGQCRVKGQYAYHHYGRHRDHLFAIYIGVMQGNGITALIDTGMESVEEMNRGAGFLLSELIWQEPGEDTHSILDRAGVKPEDVDYVFLTHCHYDHCSMLPIFHNAKAVVPERAWRLWHEEPESTVYLHEGFLDHLEERKADGKLLTCEDGVVVPGIGVRWVGGHSPCSQFVYVNTEKGVAVDTGDTVQLYGNLEHDDIVGIWENADECQRALEIARTDVDILLPGHEPQILERYPGGVIA